MRSKYFGSYQCPTNNAATRYYALFPKAGAQSGSIAVLFAGTGTFRRLRARLAGNPTADNSSSSGYDVTLRLGLGTGTVSDTALSVSIRGDTVNFQSADITHEISVAAGDHVELSATPIGSPANAPGLSFELEYEGDDTVWSARTVTGTLAAVSPIYQCVVGSRVLATTESGVVLVSPCAGTITSLYGQIATATGAGAARALKARVNGVDQGTGLSWSNEGGTKSVTEDIAVAQGDVVTCAWTCTGTPASTIAQVSMTFAPVTSGHFVVPFAGYPTALSTATRYLPCTGTNVPPSSTETDVQEIWSSDSQIIGMTAWLQTAPGAGNAWTLQLRENAGTPSTTFAVALTGAETVKSSSGEFMPTDGALYDTASSTTGSASGCVVAASYLGYMDPGTADVPVVASALCLLGVG